MSKISTSTQEFEKQKQEYIKRIETLNNHINSLQDWNGYAESCQRDYDFLLKDYNEFLKRIK